jgi:dynein assembly factor 5
VELRDRYSFWHKILPMLLAGETDDVEELRQQAREDFYQVPCPFHGRPVHPACRTSHRRCLPRQAGLLYEKENEERLKDQVRAPGAATYRFM